MTNESFYAVTAHYIGSEGILTSTLLQCERFPDCRHNAANIADYLKKTFEKWDISSKIVAITTDNAAVMVAAVRILGVRHLGCFAHTLNLLVQNSLKEVNELQQKVKAVVEHFKRSTLSLDKLKTYQEQHQLPPHRLIQDISTRWNSTFYMFERFSSLKVPLRATMAELEYESGLDLNDWQDIAQITDALGLFELVTKEISSEKEVVISKIPYMMEQIFNM